MPDASLTFTVSDDDTAVAVGSGSLPLLATPRLLAWCEAATCAAIDPTLENGSTSVGTRITFEHSGASPVGQQVEVTASEVYVDGRLHRFSVAARHLGPPGDGPTGEAPSGGEPSKRGRVVGTGEITRLVADADWLLSRV